MPDLNCVPLANSYICSFSLLRGILEGVEVEPTFVDGNSDMIRNIVFPDVNNVVTHSLVCLLAIFFIIAIEI